MSSVPKRAANPHEVIFYEHGSEVAQTMIQLLICELDV